MVVSELMALIGREGFLRVENLTVPVRIADARNVWNRVDVLIQPIGGEGEKWVSRDRVCVE